MAVRIFYYTTAVLAILLFSAVGARKSDPIGYEIQQQHGMIQKIIGSYRCNLPCVDCDMIHTLLQLREDHSFTLYYEHIGRSLVGEHIEGAWEVKKNILILEGVDYKFKIKDGALIQLDLADEEIDGDIAHRYRFDRIRS